MLDAALTQSFGSPPVSREAQDDGLKFIDLFAGIGGIRIGLESAGARCVFTSEWDKYAVRTYSENFPREHEIYGDITKVDAAEIPDHDILAGGFPCQPFSLAGVSKKNSLGRSHGFLDETQGTLFFDVARIVAAKRPRALLLENVKNLLSHDRGETFRVIRRVLEEELNYRLHVKVIDAQDYVPQHRERVIIVGYRDGEDFDWSEVKSGSSKPTMGSVLHSIEDRGMPYVDSEGNVLDKYTLSDGLWSYLQSYAEKHRAAGNGFGYGIITSSSVSRTLSARYYKDGSEILVSQGEGRNPRRLTPRECARLMGYDDSFTIPVSDTQAYRQFGNSVAVPVMKAVANQLVRPLAGD